MAFNIKYFGGEGGQSTRGLTPQSFGYKTADTLATVLAAGYFDQVAAMMDIGDTISILVVDSVTTPTAIVAADEIIVTSKSTTTPKITTSDYALASTGVADFSGRLHRVPFFVSATDLSAGTSQFVVNPLAGIIQRVVTAVEVAISTGGSITLKAAGTAVAGVSVTVAGSAAVNTVNQSAATVGDASAVVAAGVKLEIVVDAAFTGGGELTGYVEVLTTDYSQGDIFIPWSANQTDLLAGTSQWIASPVDGQIIEIGTIVQTAITTGGAITAKLATVAVVGLSATIADAAAVGSVVIDAPTSLTGATGAVLKDAAIEVVLDAAFATAGAVNGYIRVRPTVQSSKKYLFWFANQTDVLAPTSHFIAVPEAGTINRASTVVNIAIGTGGDVTYKNATVTVLGLTNTIANSAVAGNVVADTATFNDITTEFKKDVGLEIVFGAAFASTGSIWGYVELTPRAN